MNSPTDLQTAPTRTTSTLPVQASWSKTSGTGQRCKGAQIMPAASSAAPTQRVSARLSGTCEATQAQRVTSLQPREAEELCKKAAQAALDLHCNGWASVEGVLPEEECRRYEDGFWEWMVSLGTGIKRDDPSTWHSAWPPSFRGILNSLEVAHQAFVWRVRKQPRLLKIFEDLWGSSALLSSFDSINALAPSADPPTEAWLHVDQAPWRRGICCVQGLVNLVDVSPQTTGTLLVKECSHAAHEPFFTEVSKMPVDEQIKIGDHYQFTEEELPYWEQYKSRGIQGKAGSLFLWDSRTVHANVFPKRLESFRHVVYTCYQPREMAAQEDLEQKQKAYQEYLLTTHWPAMNIRTYDKDQAMEYYGVADAKNRPKYQIHRTRQLIEDRRLLQLAGVEPYRPEEVQKRTPMMEMSVEQLQALL